jgi:hypothetical protein
MGMECFGSLKKVLQLGLQGKVRASIRTIEKAKNKRESTVRDNVTDFVPILGNVDLEIPNSWIR